MAGGGDSLKAWQVADAVKKSLDLADSRQKMQQDTSGCMARGKLETKTLWGSATKESFPMPASDGDAGHLQWLAWTVLMRSLWMLTLRFRQLVAFGLRQNRTL